MNSVKKFEDYSKEENEQIFRKGDWKTVEVWTGIELNIFEEIALNIYRKSFEERGKEDSSWADYDHYFLLDCFGLDGIELGRRDTYRLPDFKVKPYGMDLLGDERFKKYCKRNVDIWREERGLI